MQWIKNDVLTTKRRYVKAMAHYNLLILNIKRDVVK